ncbi:restriction endonuclease [Chloroflexota bacterium]
MAYPKQKEIELPLLIELDKAGGQARPADLYGKIAQYFPQLTAVDLERRMENYPSSYKWSNKVQWARQTLVEKDEIDGSTRGIWKITERGRERLGKMGKKEKTDKLTKMEPEPVEPTFRDLLEAHEATVRSLLLGHLFDFEPTAFEHFGKQLLEAVGFTDVEVTQISRDGGIDGYGKLRQGIVKINAAFQCKRWRNSVPRAEIDRFRGAISGRYDQGIFLATSNFSAEASEASVRQGAVPIILIDGERIIDLMIQHNIGVSRRPLYLLDINEEFFTQ